jgi:hypothetical protein
VFANLAAVRLIASKGEQSVSFIKRRIQARRWRGERQIISEMMSNENDGSIAVSDLCAQVLDAIQACRSIEDFVQVYNSTAFQQLLTVLKQSLSTSSAADADTWARDWAVRMRTALDGPDFDVNQCRRTVLKLLYELCNAWQDNANESVTETSIVSIFQGPRVETILLLTLPLDRAQCLYAMKYPSTNQFGMHWVSSTHVENDPIWRDRLSMVDGLPTMNKRFLWLQGLTGLQLASPDIVARWLQPTECETYMT